MLMARPHQQEKLDLGEGKSAKRLPKNMISYPYNPVKGFGNNSKRGNTGIITLLDKRLARGKSVQSVFLQAVREQKEILRKRNCPYFR